MSILNKGIKVGVEAAAKDSRVQQVLTSLAGAAAFFTLSGVLAWLEQASKAAAVRHVKKTVRAASPSLDNMAKESEAAAEREDRARDEKFADLVVEKMKAK